MQPAHHRIESYVRVLKLNTKAFDDAVTQILLVPRENRVWAPVWDATTQLAALIAFCSPFAETADNNLGLRARVDHAIQEGMACMEKTLAALKQDSEVNDAAYHLVVLLGGTRF